MRRQVVAHSLHFTQTEESQPGLPPGALTLDLLQELGLTSGMPFFLTAEGEYPKELNGFFRSLPSDGCHAPASWLAYARDVDACIHYLYQVPKVHWLDATWEDLTNYKAIRRGPDADKFGTKISGKSWNRSLAAIDRLYRYAVEEGYLAKSPFRYRTKVSGGPTAGTDHQTIKSNKLRDREHDEEMVKCITLEEYKVFRDVGLLGRLPDGSVDPEFNGQFGTRNALFADLCIETGLRVGEAASQTIWELPPLPGAAGSASMKLHIAPGIAKRNKARTVRINVRLLRRIHDYVDIERDNILVDSQPSSTINPMLVRRKARGRYIEIATGRDQSIGEAAPRTRRRMHEASKDGSAKPIALWISKQLGMLTEDSWRSIFRDASARCTRLGYPMEVHPHTLRHTFAVYVLQRLIRAVLGRADVDELKTNPDAAKYRRLIGDPLRILQRMLGHSSITMTYRYLTLLDETIDIADVALEAWTSDLQSAGGGAT